jgi:hypothetical protein
MQRTTNQMRRLTERSRDDPMLIINRYNILIVFEKNIVDAAVHSEHVLLYRCGIGRHIRSSSFEMYVNYYQSLKI